MKVKATAVEVIAKHGKVTVRLVNRTPRGTKYIKKDKILEVKDIFDEKFKAEMAAAVIELAGSDEPAP